MARKKKKATKKKRGAVCVLRKSLPPRDSKGRFTKRKKRKKR